MFHTWKQNFKQMKSKRAIRYNKMLLYLSHIDKTDSKEMEKIRLYILKTQPTCVDKQCYTSNQLSPPISQQHLCIMYFISFIFTLTHPLHLITLITYLIKSVLLFRLSQHSNITQSQIPMDIQYSQNNFDDDTFEEALRQQEPLQVKMLLVDCNRLTNRSIQIMRPHNWQNLQHVLLNDNPLDSKGWKYLVQIYMPKIKTLNLDHTQAADEGLNYLARADWKSLSSIWIGGNNLRKTDKLTKSNLKNMMWVSFNVANDTTAQFSLWESQKILQVDWKAINCIFFAKQGLNERQQSMFLGQAKSCFKQQARLQFS